jgi:hypothetical protein
MLKDSDIVKKRKGEFPEWKPRPSKRKNIDFEKLRELYMNNNSVQNCNNVIKEPDFEVVSGDIRSITIVILWKRVFKT